MSKLYLLGDSFLVFLRNQVKFNRKEKIHVWVVSVCIDVMCSYHDLFRNLLPKGNEVTGLEVRR